MLRWERDIVWEVFGLTIFVTGFEGHAHPYKQNILRVDGEKSSILDLPEVKATMEKTTPAPASS